MLDLRESAPAEQQWSWTGRHLGLLLFALSTGVALRQQVAPQQALDQVIALVLGELFHRPGAIAPSGWGCRVWTACPARTLKPWSQRGCFLLTDYIKTPSDMSDEAG
jgi:hypothetical protein